MYSTTRLEQFSGLIHQIYAASAEPIRWPDTVGAIAQAMGAISAILFTPYVGPGSGGLLFPWRIEEKVLTVWAAKYINHDIWAQNAQRKGLWQEGVVALDEDFVPHEELLASIFYSEFLSTIGVGRVCSGVVFEGAPGLPSTSMTVFRGPDDPFGAPERELMRILVPHLSRSLGLMHRLNQARYQMESLRAALNRLSVGVFLLNHSLQVIHTNTAGQQALDRDDGLTLDSHRRITAAGFQRTDDLRLEAWLAAMIGLAEAERSSFSSTFEVARKDVAQTYSVQCCTFEPNDPLALGEGACHIVFVTDPKRVELPDPQALQTILGLSPAESRVSRALVQGGSYRDVAFALGVSEETVRTQIRSVYAKTRTGDKAGLTRLVWSLAKAAI